MINYGKNECSSIQGQAGKEIAISFGKAKEIVAWLVPPEVNKEIKRKIGLLEGKASVKFSKNFKIPEVELHRFP